MSSGARIAIGVVSSFGAISFALIGMLFGPVFRSGSLPLYVLALFWAVVALACFVRRTRSITLRIIGAIVFGLFAAGGFASYGTEEFPRAMLGILVLGLPAGYVALKGSYPIWGIASAAFRGDGDCD